MKLLLTSLLIALFFSVVVYLGISIYHATLNIKLWSEEGRFLLSFLFCAFFIVFTLFGTNPHNLKNK